MVRKPRAGACGRVHFRKTLAHVSAAPQGFPLVETIAGNSRFRRARIGKFAYDVIFEILPAETLIVAVAHHSREPGYWRNRTP